MAWSASWRFWRVSAAGLWLAVSTSGKVTYGFSVQRARAIEGEDSGSSGRALRPFARHRFLAPCGRTVKRVNESSRGGSESRAKQQVPGGDDDPQHDQDAQPTDPAWVAPPSGRRADEGVPEVEDERQERRTHETLYLGSPHCRSRDRDRRPVGQREPEGVARRDDPEGRHAIAKHRGDDRVTGHEGDDVRRRERLAGGDLDQSAGDHRRNAGEGEERDEESRQQDRGPVLDGQRADRTVDPGFERQCATDDQECRGQRRNQPQPERHEPDGAETADGGHRGNDEGLDRHAGPGLPRPRIVAEDLERPEEHRPEEKPGDDPDEGWL